MHFPSKCAVPVFLSNKQDKSSTNMLKRSYLIFLYQCLWPLNKRSKHSTRIQLNTSECNTPIPMTRISRNNFVFSFKSCAHSKMERKMIIKRLSILVNIWKPFSKILTVCKVKIKKQKLYWWHSEIFIKKPNGMERTCIFRSNKSCLASLSIT